VCCVGVVWLCRVMCRVGVWVWVWLVVVGVFGGVGVVVGVVGGGWVVGVVLKWREMEAAELSAQAVVSHIDPDWKSSKRAWSHKYMPHKYMYLVKRLDSE